MRRRMTKVRPDDGRAWLIYGVFDIGLSSDDYGGLLRDAEVVRARLVEVLRRQDGR